MKFTKYIIIGMLTLLQSTGLYAAVKNNVSAPDFTLTGMDGKEYSLSKYKGKVVVLEWLNHGCPFVRKHYDSNNMQALQKKYKKEGVVWLSIISSAEGKQGYSTPKVAMNDYNTNGAHSTTVLFDTNGKVGRTYGAKTTPHMFVIDKQGTLRYQGAIDSIRSADKADIASAKNYIDMAVPAVLKNKEVAMASTRPYGCSVKY